MRFTGNEILNAPLKQFYLPTWEDTRMRVLNESDCNYYVNRFVNKYGEQPVFEVNVNGEWNEQVTVLNAKFNEDREREIEAKRQYLNNF